MADISSHFKQKYIQEKLNHHLPIKLILPTQLTEKPNISGCPEDLPILMSNYKNPRNYENHDKILVDPAEMYNRQPDYGVLSFSGPEAKKVNEDAAGVIGSIMAGSAIGGAAIGAGYTVISGSILSFGAAALAAAAPAALTWWGIGHAMGREVGNNLNIDDSGYKADDNKIDNAWPDPNDNSKTYYTPDVDAKIKNGQYNEMLDHYINAICSSFNTAFADIMPTNNVDQLLKLKEYLYNIISEVDTNADKWLLANGTAIIKAKDDRDADMKEARKNKRQGQTEIIDLLGIFTKFDDIKGLNDKNRMKAACLVAKELQVNDEKLKSKSFSTVEKFKDALLDCGIDLDEIIAKVNKTDESIYSRYANRLNESDDESDSIPVFNAQTVYSRISSNVSEFISRILTKHKAEDIPGVLFAIDDMKALKEGADKTVQAKIDLVCRINNAGENSGLSAKISGFLVKHPLRATELKDVWNRHMVDLNRLMNTHILLMTDYSNQSRALGWTIHTLTTVLPDIIAKILTLRYITQVLKDNKVIQYTSQMEKDLSDEYETKKGKVNDAIEALINAVFSDAVVDRYKDDKSKKLKWFSLLFYVPKGKGLDPLYIEVLLQAVNNNKIGMNDAYSYLLDKIDSDAVAEYVNNILMDPSDDPIKQAIFIDQPKQRLQQKIAEQANRIKDDALLYLKNKYTEITDICKDILKWGVNLNDALATSINFLISNPDITRIYTDDTSLKAKDIIKDIQNSTTDKERNANIAKYFKLLSIEDSPEIGALINDAVDIRINKDSFKNNGVIDNFAFIYSIAKLFILDNNDINKLSVTEIADRVYNGLHFVSDNTLQSLKIRDVKRTLININTAFIDLKDGYYQDFKIIIPDANPAVYNTIQCLPDDPSMLKCQIIGESFIEQYKTKVTNELKSAKLETSNFITNLNSTELTEVLFAEDMNPDLYIYKSMDKDVSANVVKLYEICRNAYLDVCRNYVMTNESELTKLLTFFKNMTVYMEGVKEMYDSDKTKYQNLYDQMNDSVLATKDIMQASDTLKDRFFKVFLNIQSTNDICKLVFIDTQELKYDAKLYANYSSKSEFINRMIKDYSDALSTNQTYKDFIQTINKSII